jgi:hypothetical protein
MYKLILNVHGIPLHLPFDFRGQAASSLIKDRLELDEPCMICRFGENELRTVVAYLNIKNNIKPNFKGLLRRESFSLEDNRVKLWMYNNAGFFPVNTHSLSKFAEMMINDMKYVDILACWLPRELRIRSYLNKNFKAVPMGDLAPWIHKPPWTIAFKSKKVLVVHPFEKTIIKQYAKKEKLFKNRDILPEFRLITLKAVQSVTGINPGFNTWFDAFEYMCNQINNIDFDIAIIGAGAYGFPLAAYIKRMGKKAIHLGGISQLLFGIKGNRWDNSNFAKKYYNIEWTRPNAEETPQFFKKVEGGSYW